MAVGLDLNNTQYSIVIETPLGRVAYYELDGNDKGYVAMLSQQSGNFWYVEPVSADNRADLRKTLRKKKYKNFEFME